MLHDLFQAAAHLAKTEGVDASGWRLVTNVGRDVVRHRIVQDIVEAYRVFGEQRARADG